MAPRNEDVKTQLVADMLHIKCGIWSQWSKCNVRLDFMLLMGSSSEQPSVFASLFV